MQQIDASFDGRSIEVRAGDSVEISLAENQSAGFRWNVASGGEPACTLVQDYVEAHALPPGREGVHHWQFRAEQVGVGTIKLAYCRPWEQDRPPSRTFSLEVRVSG